MKAMKSLNLNKNICRICLEDKVILSWNVEIELCGITYKDCYYKYTELQAIDSDPYPPNLCETCSDSLKNAHLLFEKALKSFKILENSHTFKESNRQPQQFFLEESEIEVTEGFPEYCEVNDICENKNPVDDMSLLNKDAEDEMCPKNVTKNKSIKLVDHAIDKKEKSMSEDDIIEPGHYIEITNYESSTEDIVEQKVNESFVSKSSVSKNATKTGRRVIKKLFLCSYCPLKCDSNAVLKRHEATHSENRERTHTCSQCGLKLYNKLALNNHKKIHAENREKKYKCEFCDKAFFNRGACNVHRRIHLGLMIACPICSKEFYRQIDVDKHLLKHSAAPLQKSVVQMKKYTVQCQYCNETVATSKWKEHKAVHLGQPQVKCKICDKNFFSSDRIVQHLHRLHRKTIGEYDEFIHYYVECGKRMSHLMIKQQELVQPVIK